MVDVIGQKNPSEWFKSNEAVLIDYLGRPADACRWFTREYDTERIARLEFDSYDDRDWLEMANDADMTEKQAKDGIDWLLDNCWE